MRRAAFRDRIGYGVVVDDATCEAVHAASGYWAWLIWQFEQRLRLFDHDMGSLAGQCWRDLHERTSGYIGPLATLFKLAAARAIRTGTEKITADLLDQIWMDHDSEADLAAVRERRRRARQARGRRRQGKGGEGINTERLDWPLVNYALLAIGEGHLHPALEAYPSDFDAFRPWTQRRYFRELHNGLEDGFGTAVDQP